MQFSDCCCHCCPPSQGRWGAAADWGQGCSAGYTRYDRLWHGEIGCTPADKILVSQGEWYTGQFTGCGHPPSNSGHSYEQEMDAQGGLLHVDSLRICSRFVREMGGRQGQARIGSTATADHKEFQHRRGSSVVQKLIPFQTDAKLKKGKLYDSKYHLATDQENNIIE
ncbi:unnamed protein product [Callosobruchus maculatus]|uniref:Uncharacterized protein n=1 Tax=Callosobruchus maculatus TaxID=64391 RepID=A0A653C4B8_CALMS|nr:unnamed protein product [Callosobruchus maculatus]